MNMADRFCQDFLTFHAIYQDVSAATRRSTTTHQICISANDGSSVNFIDGSKAIWAGSCWLSSDTEPDENAWSVRLG